MEGILARLAGRAHGVVSRPELLDAGVSKGEIEHRIRIGALIRQHRGVYRVGHGAPSVEATYLAAVRACGVGAVLSGLAAAYLLGLIKGRPPKPEVTAPNDREVDGLRTTRARRAPIETTHVRGIPVTAVARTLVDIAGRLSDDELARACHEAGVRYRTTPRHVQAVLARRPRSPGAGTLRRIMAGEIKVSLSELERRFLQLLREIGLPLPVTNRPAGGRRVDCRWPEHALTVELDSYRFHNTRYAWEQDRRREREARARGDEFRRYTHDDVFESPGPMLQELTARLAGPRHARAA